MMTNSDVSVVDSAVGPSRGCGAAIDASSDNRQSESLKAVAEAGDAYGMCFNFATFYIFAQRVAWGEANPGEVAFMGRMLDVVERRGDMDVAVNSYMEGR